MKKSHIKRSDQIGKQKKELNIDDYEDIYVYMSKYIEQNPKNTEYEVWDMEKKIWRKTSSIEE